MVTNEKSRSYSNIIASFQFVLGVSKNFTHPERKMIQNKEERKWNGGEF